MIKKLKKILLSLSSKNTAFISLIIIFFILLLQSTLSLFFNETSESLTQIDIVFRTSLTSIFGYLVSVVSVNSINKKQNRENKNTTNTIGFNTETTPTTITSQLDTDNGILSTPKVTSSKLPDVPFKKVPLNYQIVVIASICIFCLLIMISVRNFGHLLIPGNSTASTIGVYRDFVSSGIGALIGLSKD